MKVIHAIVFTVLFIAILLLVYFIHVRFLPVEVVLYGALMDAGIAATLAAILLLILGRHGPLGGFEKLLLVTIWLLGGYAFAVSAPTVLDRSLSFYILEKLEQRGGGIRADRFEQVFTNEYMNEFRLISARLTEQRQSGTIIIDNGCVRLTERGRMLAGFSRFFRANFLPRRRLLDGEYTDALVDPFRDTSKEPVGYEC